MTGMSIPGPAMWATIVLAVATAPVASVVDLDDGMVGTVTILHHDDDDDHHHGDDPDCVADCADGGDGVVGLNDLLALFGGWGTTGPCDLNDDGEVDYVDLLDLLAAWGPCP